MGVLYTSSDLGPALTALNRDYYGRNTWDKAFGQVGVQADTSINQLNQNYERSLAEAYAASRQSEQALAGSQVGEGFKNLALNQNRQALQTAFEQYRQNYLEGMSKVNETAGAAVNEVNSLRQDYQDNMSAYGNAHISYLDWLYQQDASLFDKLDYQRFMTDGALKSQDMLSGMIYDAEGVLTDEGKSILQQIRNNPDLASEYRFDNYLKQTNPDLYDWASSSDEYNFTGKGTKSSTFQSLMGIGEKYDKKSVVSQETLNSYFSKFTDKYDEIYKAVENTDGNHADTWNRGFTPIDEQVAELRTLLDQLGISGDDIGVDWDKFDEYRERLDKEVHAQPGSRYTGHWNNDEVVRKAAALTYANAFKQILNRVYKLYGGQYDLKDANNQDISENASYAYGELIKPYQMSFSSFFIN